MKFQLLKAVAPFVLSKEQLEKIALMDEVKVMMNESLLLFREGRLNPREFQQLGDRLYQLGKSINTSL